MTLHRQPAAVSLSVYILASESNRRASVSAVYRWVPPLWRPRVANCVARVSRWLVVARNAVGDGVAQDVQLYQLGRYR